MMEYLKDLTLNVKLDYDYSATYVIRHDNCVAALGFLIDNHMLNEKEQQQLLEQAILEVRKDVVQLLLKKQPGLALEKITRIYTRGMETFGYYSIEGILCNILSFAEQCCKKIEKIEGGDEIISLIEDAQELVQGRHDNELLDPDLPSTPEDHSPSTREMSSSSSFQVLNSRQPMEEDNELSDLEGFEVLNFDDQPMEEDENELPILDYHGPSKESIENDLNDAIEGSPRSTLHSPSVTCSGQMYSGRC